MIPKQPPTTIVYHGKKFEFKEGFEPLTAQRYLETHADTEEFTRYLMEQYGGAVQISDAGEVLAPPEVSGDNNPMKPHHVDRPVLFHPLKAPFLPPMEAPLPTRYAFEKVEQ